MIKSEIVKITELMIVEDEYTPRTHSLKDNGGSKE